VISTSTTTNRFFFSYASFLQPTTLYVANDDGRVQEVKRLPSSFNAADLITEQGEAVSKDGTKIPFFIVHRSALVRDSNNPTLLYAYGGFDLSSTPGYGTAVGPAWIARGGVYVVANVRGGGEFGPAWHTAATRENRQRAYDDFTAVAEELIREEITSPRHLGIVGASNGGLLAGVALTEHPDLYNGAFIQSALLDMRRYSHLLGGAIWIPEFGDPDKAEDWAYMSKYSPYQNLKADTKYPPVLFATNMLDDRVHPGHVRKMAAKMESMGQPVYYIENVHGDHRGGLTNDEKARTLALAYTFLWQQLGGGGP
jgi:prolyl oligopeptidase